MRTIMHTETSTQGLKKILGEAEIRKGWKTKDME